MRIALTFAILIIFILVGIFWAIENDYYRKAFYVEMCRTHYSNSLEELTECLEAASEKKQYYGRYFHQLEKE